MYVMLVTGFKGFDEVSLKTMWDLPKASSFDNFIEAYEAIAPISVEQFEHGDSRRDHFIHPGFVEWLCAGKVEI